MLGRALILSVSKNRTGSDIELKDATGSLQKLGFDVSEVVNPTKEEMESRLRQHRDASWSEHACSCVCVMGHGYMHGAIQHVNAADEQDVNVNDLYSMLSGSNAPSLKGKPKLWIVQACRGGGDRLTDLTDSYGLSDADSTPRLSAESDQLHAYATVPDSPAYRGVFWRTFHGICQESVTKARQANFVQLIETVNQRMSIEGYKPPPLMSTLRAELEVPLPSAVSLTL